MAFEQDWLSALSTKPPSLIPFAATKRKNPRQLPPAEVLAVDIHYRRWDGEIGPWREHFGKGRGQVYSLDGEKPIRSCNEVEVAKRLRTLRQNAYWVSCYAAKLVPELWRPWVIGQDKLPDWLKTLDDSIRKHLVSVSGGIPDVVAWNELCPLQSALFVECKGEHEGFKEGQEDWVSCAIKEKIRKKQFGIARRVFET